MRHFIFGAYLLIALLAVSTFLYASKAFAGSGDNVTGWAWGEAQMPDGSAGEWAGFHLIVPMLALEVVHI